MFLRYGIFAGLCVLAGLMLASCSIGRSLLSNVEATPSMLDPIRTGEPILITYEIGCTANVSLFLENAQGQRYDLRQNEPRSAETEPYVLRFDGTVPTQDPVVRRQLLPQGSYQVVVQANSERCGSAEAQVPITIVGSDVPIPDIVNLTVWPDTISPNADAIDDVTEITYRLPVTATVDISVTTPDGSSLPLVTRDEQYPSEWGYIWNGKRPDGALLANGVYTYTIAAEDDYGNLVQRQGTITLEEVGEPEATIIYASIAPRRLMLGGTVTVTMVVKNTGPVPIRTYGPPSGYTYTTDEVFSSVEQGAYTSQAGGFWRIGVDWDANSGDGPRRYPFRWALSQRPPEQWKVPGVEDWLLPGEEVEVVGHIVVVQRETKMGFYVGLIQDGVGFFQNRTARTIVEVGF